MHAPRGVLLGRDTTRYRSLVGLAMHAPERRQAPRNFPSAALVMPRSPAGGDPADDHVADHGAEVVAVGRRGQVPTEQIAEGVLVGDLEDAIGTYHHVH